MNRSVAAASLAAFLFLSPRAAIALTVTQASIKVDPKKTDTAKFSGTLTAFGLRSTDDVTVTIDGVSYRVAHADLKQKVAKFSYRNKTRKPGVSSLTLDLRRQRFTVALKGVVLGSVRSPTRLELSGQVTECALIALATSAKHPPSDATTPDKERLRARGFKLIKDKSGTVSQSCAVSGAALVPPVLLTGDPTTVTASLQVGAPIDAGSIRLFRADVAGAPTGDALCTLLDDGVAAHGDAQAGDGSYACTLTVETAAPQRFTVVATATSAGHVFRSPVTTVRVVAPLSDADLAADLALQSQAEALWDAAKAQLGDTVQARFQVLAALRRLGGIDAVTLADETGSIAIVFPTGVIGGLALTPRSDVPVVPAFASAPERSFVMRDASHEPSTPPDDALVVDNDKVLIWYGASSLVDTEYDLAKTAYTASTCPVFDVTAVQGNAATLAVLDGMTQYGTVVLVSHGLKDRGDIGMVNGLIVENDHAGLDLRKEQLQRQELFLPGAISPRYVRQLAGDFSHTLVWSGFCYSGFDDASGGTGSTPVVGHTVDSLSDAFLSKGAGAYFGFTRTVSNTYARVLASTLFPSLIFDLKTTSDVYDAATPKIDQPEIDDLKAIDGKYSPSVIAHFVLRPPNGKPLVYLKPTLSPKNPSIDADATVGLGVTVEGATGCSLAYHWTNTATAGHLAEGDDVETASATMAYQAEDDAALAHDTITVDVLDTAHDPAVPLVRAETTIAVGCTKCAGAGCTPTEACCADDLDNDGDGNVDCDDADCNADPACGYTLAGSSDGKHTLVADDDLDVYLNGVQIYTDGTAFAGDRPPISFAAKAGDVLRFVVRDTYGICSRLHPLYLVNRQHSVLADHGFDNGCTEPDGDQGVVHDVMFTIPF